MTLEISPETMTLIGVILFVIGAIIVVISMHDVDTNDALSWIGIIIAVIGAFFIASGEFIYTTDEEEKEEAYIKDAIEFVEEELNEPVKTISHKKDTIFVEDNNNQKWEITHVDGVVTDYHQIPTKGESKKE